MEPQKEDEGSNPAPAAPPGAGDTTREQSADRAGAAPATPPEIGGRQGPDPTRYGDWELRGRCIDF